MKKHKWILCAVALGLAGTASAELYAYEGFDYAETPLGGQVHGLNGGTGFSDAWTSSDGTNVATGANFRILSGGDSWGALDVAGNRLDRVVTGGTEYLARTLAADLDATPELWFSLLLRPGQNEGFAIAGSALAEDGSIPDFTVDLNAGFGFVNSDDANLQAAVWNNSGGRVVGTSLALTGKDTLQFIVGKIAFNSGAGGEDVLSLYSVGTDLLLPGAAGASVAADLDETVLDTLTMETNRGPGYDEIRIGTTMEDVGIVGVIPEPATVGMFAAMGAGMLWIRRRFMLG